MLRVAKLNKNLPIPLHPSLSELLLAVVATPLLLFPRSFLPWVGLGLLFSGWILRGFTGRKWLVRTSLDLPIIVIFLTTIASLYPSVDLSLSMPKFYGIVLGVFVYYAVVDNVSTQRHVWLGVAILIACIAAISLLGLVGTEWNAGKYPLFQRAYALVPRLIKGIQSSVGPTAGFHPNEVGGTLAFLLPLPLALLLRARIRLLHRVLLVAVIVTGLGVLALSVSRSALVGLSVAVLGLFVWRWRLAGVVLALAAVGALAVAVSVDTQAVSELFLKVEAISSASGGNSLLGRLEIWDRARDMIEDFPFTGIGLNTFPVVLDTLYPSFLVGPDARIPHAHDIYLQTAVDLGLGGFLGFLGLWGCTAYAGWRAYRRAYRDVSVQAAVVGMLAGIASYLVFGLTDAITLGAKPTVLLWLMLGLIVAADRVTGAGDAGRVEASYDGGEVTIDGTRTMWRSAAAFVLATMVDLYWITAFFLVAMAYLVVGIGISGWVP